ncbi:hypothetical protein LOTGIDRAFT_231151 [Lottia gigantea]|uniref:Uncharacterized protein n=1 Tax=Lottia gigantea TaxID=225164 RepID=V4A495_LOTGI|nr:hypothetical protein LOTGIDRAFT_231151 [Lottia gigantea]ESO98738.1 hypothetical protein LOTGIDRAFT_231151 [Lottia gigantea]
MVIPCQFLESLVLMGLVEVESMRTGCVIKDKDAGDVSKFLNRILGLAVEKQNLIFNYFTEAMKVIIKNAKKEGRYNEGMLDITATSIQLIGKPTEIFSNLSRGHGTTQSALLKVDRGMSWEAALKKQEHSGGSGNFYVSKRDMWGRKMYILATKKDNSSHLYTICRPNTGVSAFDEEKSDLLRKYSQIDVAAAEKGWKDMYQSSGDGCMHGDSCRQRAGCSVGSRTYKLHLICGNIVTLMSVLECTLNKFSVKYGLSKYESHIRVVRVELDTGERIVGVRYPEQLIIEVEKALIERNMIEQAQSQAMISQGQEGQVLIDPPKLKTFQSITEDVASVVPRCYKKAITPPLTIKNFFKPSTSNTDSSKPTVKTECLSVSYEDFTKDVCGGDANPSDSDSIALNRAKTKDNNSQSLKKQTVEILKESKNMSKKRTANNSVFSPTLKRRKQETLFSTFAKQSSQKEVKKDISCPICGLKFEEGLGNDKINEHIDNCLIE